MYMRKCVFANFDRRVRREGGWRGENGQRLQVEPITLPSDLAAVYRQQNSATGYCWAANTSPRGTLPHSYTPRRVHRGTLSLKPDPPPRQDMARLPWILPRHSAVCGIGSSSPSLRSLAWRDSWWSCSRATCIVGVCGLSWVGACTRLQHLFHKDQSWAHSCGASTSSTSFSASLWNRILLTTASFPTDTPERRPRTWLMPPIVNSVISWPEVEGGRSDLP